VGDAEEAGFPKLDRRKPVFEIRDKRAIAIRRIHRVVPRPELRLKRISREIAADLPVALPKISRKVAELTLV
jgi:hypothetical protein